VAADTGSYTLKVTVTDDNSLGAANGVQSASVTWSLTVTGSTSVDPYWQSSLEKKVYVEVGSTIPIHLGDYSAKEMSNVDSISETI
jgi:hypothetical protein